MIYCTKVEIKLCRGGGGGNMGKNLKGLELLPHLTHLILKSLYLCNMYYCTGVRGLPMMRGNNYVT